MTPKRVPNDGQRVFADLPIADVLLVAPAGCGKTEALAVRAAHKLAQQEVPPPTRVLCLTFSNRARDNLASRMRDILGVGWRRRVTVANFHGFATRVLLAHGNVVGLDRDNLVLPDRPWRSRRLRELGINYKNSDEFERVLREAKSEAIDDTEVHERVQASGHTAALRFEQLRIEEARLDFDDQIRHAVRVLEVDDVAKLYQAHFSLVIVDEVQDLTPMQFRMVQRVGPRRTSYAGDPAQGIYSFAGAAPEWVFDQIRAVISDSVELEESYRSTPAVLRAVNALAELIGTTRLRPGDPERWPDEGHVHILRRSTPPDEAEALLAFLEQLDLSAVSVGVVARRAARAGDFREAASQRGIDFRDWGAPTHLPRVVELLKRFVQKVPRDDVDPIQKLEELCRDAVEADDAETHNEIAMACDELADALDRGVSLEEAVAACHVAQDAESVVPPGLHVLTGHIGKGQEFDWVVVLGLEDGHIPDFRSTEDHQRTEELRVLHVMVSRARYGLVVTSVGNKLTRYGWRTVDPSPWRAVLEASRTSTI